MSAASRVSLMDKSEERGKAIQQYITDHRCQDGARHSYWIVKNLFCFCVKGRSFQGVNVSELEFIWK